MQASLFTQDSLAQTVKTGDVWQMGQHILYCGDSSSLAFVELVRDARASFAFADPPYNAGVEAWDSGFVWKHDYLSHFVPLVAVTPGVASIQSFMQLTTMPYKWALCYYIDNGMTRGALGFSNYIPVFLFAQDLASVTDRVRFDRARISIVGGDRDQFKHKGRKPIRLLTHIISECTAKGDVVIDPFLGTGTTLIACEKLNRACIGAELSETYCAHIIERWERLTCRLAVKKGQA